MRLIGAEENVDQGHGYARLARAGSHDEECAALVGGEGLGEAANDFVLIGTVDDGAVDGGLLTGAGLFVGTPKNLKGMDTGYSVGQREMLISTLRS